MTTLIVKAAAGEPITIEYNVNSIKAIESVSNDPVFSDSANWGLIGYVYKHAESSKRLYVGVRKTNTTKNMKLRDALSEELYELDKLVLFDLSKNPFVVDKEDILDVAKYDITLK